MPVPDFETIINDIWDAAISLNMGRAYDETKEVRSKAVTALTQLHQQETQTCLILGKWNAYEELLLNESIKKTRVKEINVRACQLRELYQKNAERTNLKDTTKGR